MWVCVNVCVCVGVTDWVTFISSNTFIDTHIQYMHRYTHSHRQERRLSKHRNSSRRDMMMSEEGCLATHRMSSGQAHYGGREGKHTHAHRLVLRNPQYRWAARLTYTHTLLRTQANTHTNMSHLMNMSHLLQRGWRDAWWEIVMSVTFQALWPNDQLYGSCVSVVYVCVWTWVKGDIY